MKKRRSWWKILLFLGLLILFHAQICESLARLFLYRNDKPLANSDFLVVLMGDVIPRTDATYELYKAGTANQILFSNNEKADTEIKGLTDNLGDQTFKYLTNLGVDKSAINYVSDCHATSTREEAECLKKFLLSVDPLPRRITIVTSWSHSRRAGWIFKKSFEDYLVEIQVSPAETINDNPAAWWRNEGSFFNVVGEFIKWGYHLVKYGL